LTAEAGAALVARLVERAALDGSTCLPMNAVAASLRGAGLLDVAAALTAAVDAGTVVSFADEGLVGHADHAQLEARLAAQLVRLMRTGDDDGLLVVDAPRGTEPRVVVEPLLAVVEASGGRVVERADLLDLAGAVRLAEKLPDGARLVLVGDPGMPPASAPGQVLVDVVSSGAVPVLAAPPAGDELDPFGSLVQSLRAGTLARIDTDRREVVVVPAADAAVAVRRAVQLVTDSVPRAFGVAAADVLVVAPRTDGRTGADALRAALTEAGTDGVGVCGGTELAGHGAEAIVLVLGAEAAGSLTRDLLLAAATQARRHLSIVHQAGPALADAVARRPHRSRRTRLAGLLSGSLG